MRVILAPMEGVVDHLMRDLLTQVGGFDSCVTEFVRVVEQLLPRKVFYRYCPELKTGSKTPAGVPVKVQLLGSHPEWLALNAERAAQLGSPGVDLNFGCPAKTVNKSKGGAVLLKEPQALYAIVNAVRQAIPAHLPVTAKMRLGYEDKTLALENAAAISAAGASELVIHARTKVEGYQPPAYWDWIAKVKSTVAIPLIANGEIWSADDATRCQQQSDCSDLMIGRGALAMPNLALVIKGEQSPMPWAQVLDLLARYSEMEIDGDKGRYYPNRLKQWLRYLKVQYPQAETLYQQVRRLNRTSDILTALQPLAA